MRFDLLTLYFLAIGTLLLSAGMTAWERHARPERAKELGLLAVGYAALAIGCTLATVRDWWPQPIGAAASNMVMLSGYLVILNGVAALRGRSRRAFSMGLLAVMASLWMTAGVRWSEVLWSYVSAAPIAVACGLTAWEIQRCDKLRHLRSWRIVVAFAAVHGLFYACRAMVLPLLVSAWGASILTVASKVTMYEGVLYSVGLPMALLALIREEAHAKLEKASRTDYLTGLGNRRWFFEEGERVLGRASGGKPCSLLAFDLDHFKTINDRFGHAVGDEVLKLFARVVGGAAGQGPVLARLGGEEFVALLPGVSRERAGSLGSDIAARFATTVVDHVQGVGVAATVSIGLAELGRDGESLTDLLSAADRALYLAKERGRNRIEFARPLTLAAAS
ncbi:sensor domain-containing diguanylate cyclase [Novosphingobium sp. M1R2S20]|uniref:diguanylate cyclase n=1 Tax=Novosphingobium rhizovicinum TaxID=3228928 RepID=A0ABV3RFZ8_9SPHN